MKNRISALLLLSVGAILCGCSGFSSVDSSGGGVPVGVSSEEQEQLAMKLKYLPLSEVLYGSEQTDEHIQELDSAYQSKLSEYTQRLPELLQNSDSSCVTNFLPETALSPLSGYSPIAKVFYANKESIGINPVVLVDKLTSGERHVNDDLYTAFSPEHDYSINAPVVYEDRAELIRSAMQTYVSEDIDYRTYYNKSENLYCVNIVSADRDLCIAALYFHFSDEGTLDRAGMDEVIYTGRELLLTDSRKEVCDQGALLFPDGNITSYSSPCSCDNLSSVMIRLMGSAVSDDRLVTGGKITAKESYRGDTLSGGTNNSYIKGIHIVSWFELET